MKTTLSRSFGELSHQARVQWQAFVESWRKQMLDEGFEEEDGIPSIDGFRYYWIHGKTGSSYVAERKQAGGPREPGYIWSPDTGRWFCSEDDKTDAERELAMTLNDAAPGGIGGF